MTISTPPDDRLSGPVHGWFGLSYSNYAVIPRALMQSMPEEWQARMVACLREINDAYRHLDHMDGYDVTAGSWETIDDCSQEQLVAAGVRTYWVDADGETIPEPDEPAAGQEPRYEWRGEEWTGQQRVFIPGATRVPHYDRGRTWVEPQGPPAAAQPQTVVLCGSTRFYGAFQQANYDLTMAGHIVLSVGFYPHAKAEHGHGEGVGHDSAEKVKLDELHLRKIDRADWVYVLDCEVDGRPYIGQSTAREIAYAERLGKPIRYLSREPAGATS